MRWRPTDATALVSNLTQGTNFDTRVVRTWPGLTQDHKDLILVITRGLFLVLGIFSLEYLGW